MTNQTGRPNFAFWRLLKTNPLPKYHLFFDAETLAEPEPEHNGIIKHRCRLISASYGEFDNGNWVQRKDYCGTANGFDFWGWVGRLRPGDLLQVWSHNIGFDATITLVPHLLSQGFMVFPGLEPAISPGDSGRFAGGKIRYFLPGKPVTVIDAVLTESDARLRLIDTANFWRLPLEELGEQVGLPKLQMPPFEAADSEWRSYCVRDVEIIMEAVRRLLIECETSRIGPFRPTLGGLAWSTLRRSWLRHSVAVRQNKLLRRFERAAYCGGQTETYRWGAVDEKVTQLDVVSLYPYMAREELLPVQAVELEFRLRSEATKPPICPGQCIADCLIESPSYEFPYKVETGTHYPVGLYWTVLCGKELEQAIRLGVVKKVASVVRYSLAPVLRPIMTSLLARRQQSLELGDRFTAKLLKEICNSLIGKIAQRGDKWITHGTGYTDQWYGTESHYDADLEQFREYRIINGVLQESITADENAAAFPAISAFVTSAAREFMRGLRREAGLDNVFYQATDCLHVNETGRLLLSSSGRIGKHQPGLLNTEGIAERVIYRGANFYCFGFQWVHSGISGRARPVSGELYTDYLWESFAGALTRPPDGTFHVSKIDKLIRPWKIDGWRVKKGIVQRIWYDYRERQKRFGWGNDYWKGDLQCT